MAKAEAVAEKVAGLRTDLAAAHELAHQAQVREALARSELTLALNEAMAGRAEAEAVAREAALRLYRRNAQETWPARPARRGGPLDQRLVRLGWPGQALLLARARVWPRAGDRIVHLRRLAAYARRPSHPELVPPPPFDQAWYLAAHPEAAASGVPPLVHYLMGGKDQARSPNPLFDPGHYARGAAEELAALEVTPLEHFVRWGAAQGRDPHPLFSIAHYLGQGPDLAPGEDPLSHYLRIGWREGLAPHPLFNPSWYVGQAPGAAGSPPLVHYLISGWREGIAPHPLFDVGWYMEQNPDVAANDAEPLSHFVVSGAAEGRDPSPWFDMAQYVAKRGDALPAGRNPLVDYLQGGAWAVAEARPGFPTAAYLAAHPELIRECMTPLEHWARRSRLA